MDVQRAERADASVPVGEQPAVSGVCPACRKAELITITMTVHGTELGFTSCHGCEAKWWRRDGTVLPLSSVIDIVAEP